MTVFRFPLTCLHWLIVRIRRFNGFASRVLRITLIVPLILAAVALGALTALAIELGLKAARWVGEITVENQA